MQCHLETSSRLLPHSIQRHGRAPFSYVAGQPLADFEATFDRAAGKNQACRSGGRRVPVPAVAMLSEERGKAALHDVPQSARYSARACGDRAIQQGVRGLSCGGASGGARTASRATCRRRAPTMRFTS